MLTENQQTSAGRRCSHISEAGRFRKTNNSELLRTSVITAHVLIKLLCLNQAQAHNDMCRAGPVSDTTCTGSGRVGLHFFFRPDLSSSLMHDDCV